MSLKFLSINRKGESTNILQYCKIIRSFTYFTYNKISFSYLFFFLNFTLLEQIVIETKFYGLKYGFLKNSFFFL